jgi:hypothetical protein
MPPTARPAQTAARFRSELGNEPVRYADALAAGFTPGALRIAVARGLLLRPRHGWLAVGADAPAADPILARRRATSEPGAQTSEAGEPWSSEADAATRQPAANLAVSDPAADAQAAHLAALSLALRDAAPGTMASHESAAMLHGLPVPWQLTSRLSLVRPGAPDYDGPDLRLRGTGVPMHRRCVIDGIPATTLERTAIDLARGRHLPSALIPLDAALRLLVGRELGVPARASDGPDPDHGPDADPSAGVATGVLRRAVLLPAYRERARERLRRCLHECFGWPGTRVVREALEVADPAAESPAESVSRGWLIEAGLRGLTAGVPISCGSTTYWADLCHQGRRVIGEVDGWAKYGSSAEAVRRELTRERDRQRRLESAGWTVVRWSLSDGRATVIARMSAALSPT